MRRAARHHKRGNFFGGLISLILLILLGFAAYQFLPKLLENHEFDRFNLVIGGPNVNLVSLDRTNKSATVIRLPNDLYLFNVIHGYGQYQLSSVYGAGQLDKRGGETLAGTVREYLGIPVDGYYYTDRNLSDAKNFFLSIDFLFKANSDLSIIDRFKFAFALLGVRFDRITNINLGKFTSPIILADGSNAQSLEALEVDSALGGMFVEHRIRDENLRVEVINTTPMTGLGARAMRLLTNIGLSVVNVDSNTDLVPNCQVEVAENALKSITLARVIDIYNCKISKKTGEGRAAVSVLLGEDFSNWLSQ